jgi:hypothetical protein
MYNNSKSSNCWILLQTKFTVTSLNEPYAVLDLQSSAVIPGIGLIPAVPALASVLYGFKEGAPVPYALEASPTPNLNFLGQDTFSVNFISGKISTTTRFIVTVRQAKVIATPRMNPFISDHHLFCLGSIRLRL